MIPKIIHWCWLSNDPIPQKLCEFMESWKAYLPDYEFILWNFSRFPHGKSCWVDTAFENKKYAFAADYIRLYALYNYGGIYLDMDVEVCKSFNPFLNLKTMLCWQKSIDGLEVAAFGVEKKSPWVRECLQIYDSLVFKKKDGSFDLMTLPVRIEKFFKENGYSLINVKNVSEAMLVHGEKSIPVFPSHFFSPKSYLTEKIYRNKETVCIHHFAGSWIVSQNENLFFRFKNFVWKKTGLADLQMKKRLRRFLKRIKK